jgi:hypothetical protein
MDDTHECRCHHGTDSNGMQNKPRYRCLERANPGTRVAEVAEITDTLIGLRQTHI